MEHFLYILYTCKNPFIHLSGSLLVQWMIVRIIGKEEPKPDLQVRLGGASLRLAREVRLGEPEKCLNSFSDPPRRRSLRLGGALHLGVHSYA